MEALWKENDAGLAYIDRYEVRLWSYTGFLFKFVSTVTQDSRVTFV